MSGRSITNDCRSAAFRSGAANSPWRRLARRSDLRSSGEGSRRGALGIMVVVDMASSIDPKQDTRVGDVRPPIASLARRASEGYARLTQFAIQSSLAVGASFPRLRVGLVIR